MLKRHHIWVQGTGSYVCLLHFAIRGNQRTAIITTYAQMLTSLGQQVLLFEMPDWLVGSLSHIWKVIVSTLRRLCKAMQQAMTHRVCRLPHPVGPAFIDCCAQGAQCLATALREAHSLEVLRLDDNPLTEHGGSALAAGVWHSQSLRELHLCNTGIGDEGEV